MPIYEFDCPDCHQRVSLFFRTFGAAQAALDAAVALRCPRCQGAHLQRAVSRVAPVRSEARRMAALDDAANLDALAADDPHAMAHLMRTMRDELGEPMDAETTDMVERLDAGELPGE
jgi:putative FmdB family regulatory protein